MGRIRSVADLTMDRSMTRRIANYLERPSTPYFD
ncbi:hypothetical protein EV652_11877 [Kribbella steppae]|uniref:Uncharacterized protein n=1 Tax=Kribbella steppae TaxID=2512223 RepID=A0A4R2GZM0_9ACTN|nr:hypothetical protein EV652_11877 [Kribbella steppae]